jgi:hypothetical protein
MTSTTTGASDLFVTGIIREPTDATTGPRAHEPDRVDLPRVEAGRGARVYDDVWDWLTQRLQWEYCE